MKIISYAILYALLCLSSVQPALGMKLSPSMPLTVLQNVFSGTGNKVILAATVAAIGGFGLKHLLAEKKKDHPALVHKEQAKDKSLSQFKATLAFGAGVATYLATMFVLNAFFPTPAGTSSNGLKLLYTSPDGKARLFEGTGRSGKTYTVQYS